MNSNKQPAAPVDAAEYCRQIEAYLCRKNEGHLIRIVGPVFQQVSGWAVQGVPLAVAFQGIDQYCERYYAKGPRRRPVRVEFCEADILSLFDDWRRAVGVSRLDGGPEPARDRIDTLPAHLERIIARLTGLRGRGMPADLDRRLEAAVRELDSARAAARQARGEARAALLARLAALDGELLGAARESIEPARAAQLRAAAEADIAPFAARMAADVRATALEAAFDRQLRDALDLPVLRHEP